MKRRVAILFGATTLFSAVLAVATSPDPNINYLVSGQAVHPWELSLQFGKVKLDGETRSGETAKSSLVAVASDRSGVGVGDAMRFTWRPRGVKNQWGGDDEAVSTVSLTSPAKSVDLSPVYDQAALTMDVRVIRAPNKPVRLSLQCGWQWQCRAAVPLKSVLRRVKKNEWVTIPIPLQCFDSTGDYEFDFSQVTTMLMLHTGGKMDLEISDLRLTAFPPDKVNCGR